MTAAQATSYYREIVRGKLKKKKKKKETGRRIMMGYELVQSESTSFITSNCLLRWLKWEPDHSDSDCINRKKKIECGAAFLHF